jgi:hypothetical protein
MLASSVTRRLLAGVVVRNWAWWRLSGLLRSYVGSVPLAALAGIAVAASQTTWRVGDLEKFILLLTCGMISVVATPRIAYGQGAMVRDFLTVWVLPVAILLPPCYAMVTPVPLLLLTQWRVHRGVVYRRVFTGAAIGLAYGAASLVFHAMPASFAGGALGTGMHALTWTAAVACCEIVGWLGHHVLLVIAVKLSDPRPVWPTWSLTARHCRPTSRRSTSASLSPWWSPSIRSWRFSPCPRCCWPGGS